MDVQDVWPHYIGQKKPDGKLYHYGAALGFRDEQLIKKQLKRYTVEQLKEAIDGCLLSPWHRGQNPNGVVYEDLELICRDATKVDQFIEIGATSGGSPDAAEDDYVNEVVEQTLARRKRIRRVTRRDT